MKVETATVYRSLNGRRYFLKESALRKDALFKIKEKYGEIEHDESREYATAEWLRRWTIATRYARRYRKAKDTPND